jgi:hypothetical protein
MWVLLLLLLLLLFFCPLILGAGVNGGRYPLFFSFIPPNVLSVKQTNSGCHCQHS